VTQEVRNIVIGLVLACLFLGWLARDAFAQDCEYGTFGCFHHENHDAYKEWKTGQGGSCCNGKDCRPRTAHGSSTFPS
jgi:hypothetical protein